MTAFLLPLLHGVTYTIALTICSLALGAVVALPVCAMRVSQWRLVNCTAFAIILLVRSIPPIVWLFLIFFGLGSGFIDLAPFPAAVVALGVISAASLAEIYRGALTAIHPGQKDAAQALALSARSRLIDIILPQMARISLPASTTYAIGLLKDTAIASTIGVQDITFFAQAITQRSLRGLEAYTAAGIIYILLSISFAFVGRHIELRLAAKVAL
ncbi:amino acid ABC transporter permease [Mesorhizobium sp. ArgA1]